MQLGAGSGLHPSTVCASAEPAPSGSPRELDPPGSDHPAHPESPNGLEMGPELGALPPQIGKADPRSACGCARNCRPRWPPALWRCARAGPTRRAAGAALGPSRARAAAAPAAEISPEPQAPPVALTAHPEAGSLARRLRRLRQTAGSCARRTGRRSRRTPRASRRTRCARSLSLLSRPGGRAPTS